MEAQEVHIPLNEGWSFCQVGQERWYPAEVPGVVQTDLLRNGLIPDYMQGSNIDSVQWIENEDWIYKRNLFVADTLLRHGHLDLVFKGLDTFAEVYLNDSLIGKADNMFRTWEWEVKRHLKKGENELKVIFRSPIKEGAKLREAYGIQLPHDNDPSGVSPYIRKAAYQFGWDFCPRLVTSGIWKGVELRAWSGARILNAEMEFEIDSNEGEALLNLMFDSDALRKPGLKVFLNDSLLHSWRFHDGEMDAMDHIVISKNVLDRWWPIGFGKQPLYKIRVEVYEDRKLLSTFSRSFGSVNVNALSFVDDVGSSFGFYINGRKVFAKGCNLIPPSLTPSMISDSMWVAQVRHMQIAGMNTVRVWSGGIYPPEAFYYACDTAGILVWQDFMIANLVPAEGDFLKNIKAEAYEHVSRMKHHPCLALHCGNNELRVAWQNWGWQERYGLNGGEARRIIETNEALWTKELWQIAPGMYTPTSPLSNWGNARGLTEGDLHYWGVWHGDSTFSSFKNNVGRFVSEWGFQSYPDSALLAKYIHPDSLYLGSSAVARLQRSYKTDRPIWEAIGRELGEERPTTLGGFIEASQRAQAKAYGMAIEAHLAAQPHCMGTLLWQLNDCWPGPSWSIIDYEGNPKPAYEVVKRLYSAP
ncbi:MAG: hypothetical protein JNJ91_03865 [Flavobacteriales bacterium]|nr:hypothetical protein [Flavobacteriales bacterium]